MDWNETSKNIAKHPSCSMEVNGSLWTSPVGRRCSGCMILGTVGASLGDLHGVPGLTARHSALQPLAALKTALQDTKNLEL